MLEIDCSNLPRELSTDIFEHVTKSISDDDLSKINFLPQSQLIIVNAKNRNLHGQLIQSSQRSLIKLIHSEYISKYDNDKIEYLKNNGIIVRYTTKR